MTISSPIMVLLPYTPRPDADARGYDDWLREVDNPFFNAVPGIVHYSNWKVSGPVAGFSHFDFMFLDPSLADGVWSNPAVVDFAAGWTRQWGTAPDAADLSVNYHSYLMRHVTGRGDFDRRGVRLGGSASPVTRFGGSVWEVTEAMVGSSPHAFYEVAFGPATVGGDAVAGTLIAAPGD